MRSFTKFYPVLAQYLIAPQKSFEVKMGVITAEGVRAQRRIEPLQKKGCFGLASILKMRVCTRAARIERTAPKVV